MTARAANLPAFALFAALLSAAGLPIYLSAPKFYAESFGVSLAALGTLLFALRLVDVVQDPVFGWLAERIAPRRASLAVACAGGVMALSMLGLFAVEPPIAPLWWFGLTITGLFSAFSYLTIAFYGAGVAKAARLPGGHLQLAGWRETGGLVGICVAAVAPTLLVGVTAAPMVAFAAGFAGIAVLALWFMRGEWAQGAATEEPVPFTVILRDPLARRLLLLAFVNAAPLAVSSTLFLFFVDQRLQAQGWEGPLLVLFFLSAAVSAPLWGRIAARVGTKPTLLAAMAVAMASFAFALTLGPGQVAGFAAICVVSGATIGADLTLMPALFARRLARIAPRGGQGFGLWGFVNKATLAVAAVVLLPLLDRAGFRPGAETQPEAALGLLGLLYAGVPVGLKLFAMALLWATDLEDRR